MRAGACAHRGCQRARPCICDWDPWRCPQVRLGPARRSHQIKMPWRCRKLQLLARLQLGNCAVTQHTNCRAKPKAHVLNLERLRRLSQTLCRLARVSCLGWLGHLAACSRDLSLAVHQRLLEMRGFYTETAPCYLRLDSGGRPRVKSLSLRLWLCAASVAKLCAAESPNCKHNHGSGMAVAPAIRSS